MAFRFDGMKVLGMASVPSNKIDVLADNFPRKEMFNLHSQIRGVAGSAALYNTEESSGQNKLGFKRSLEITLRPGAEIAACLYLAYTQKHITRPEYRQSYTNVKYR